MTKTIFFFTLFCFAFIFSSCGIPLTYVSFKDPSFRHQDFRHICVYAKVNNLIMRRNIEDAIVATFKENGVRAVSSLYITPPTRTWTDADLKKQLEFDKIDGYLVLELSDKYNVKRIVPAQQIVTKTLNTVEVEDHKKERKKRTDSSAQKSSRYVNNYSTTETMTIEDKPSYTLKYTYVTCSLMMYDVASMNLAWQQKITESDGTGFEIDNLDNGMFIDRIAISILEGMIKDRAIR